MIMESLFISNSTRRYKGMCTQVLELLDKFSEHGLVAVLRQGCLMRPRNKIIRCDSPAFRRMFLDMSLGDKTPVKKTCDT